MSWTCPNCGETYPDADPGDAQPCLADQEWYRRMYPPGVQHHYRTGRPWSVDDARFWISVAEANRHIAAAEE